MSKPTCKLDGCERPARASGGWCFAHWNRVRRNGDPGSPVVKDRRTGCLVDGCNAKHYGRGYCQTHRYRLVANGDPLTVRPPGPQGAGPEHPNWRGEDVRYSAVHVRLRRQRGKAAGYSCVECNGQAAEWAYINGSPDELWDEKVRRRYSANLDHYQPMCVPCHRQYDTASDGLVDDWLAAGE